MTLVNNLYNYKSPMLFLLNKISTKLLLSETLPTSEIVSLSKWSSLTILNEQEYDSSSIPDKEGYYLKSWTYIILMNNY